MTITIERNQKIQNLNTHTHTHTEKYKRKMCYHQKNNLDVRTFERPKNIYMTTQQRNIREKQVIFKRIYNSWYNH